MIPVLQDKFYDASEPENVQRGNCWTACIASLIEVPLAEVPNFVEIEVDGGENWFDHTLKFLKAGGYGIKQHTIAEMHPDCYYIVTGESYRFNGYHAVIYKGRNMAFDPVPDGFGVKGITGVYSVVNLTTNL